MLTRAAFIEPSLPSPADRLPSSPDWVHEIKHDGYGLMARRDFSWTKPARPERDRTPLR
jgi:ATP-dependent DNA ligase